MKLIIYIATAIIVITGAISGLIKNYEKLIKPIIDGIINKKRFRSLKDKRIIASKKGKESRKGFHYIQFSK